MIAPRIVGWNDAPPMVHLTLSSSNIKTGPIPVTTSGRSTCPDACPLKKANGGKGSGGKGKGIGPPQCSTCGGRHASRMCPNHIAKGDHGFDAKDAEVS